MCGFVGILERQAKPGTPAIVKSMLAALEHRGPDGEGFARVTPSRVEQWKEGPIPLPDHGNRCLTLGHRRLSIFDQSAAGHQPMGFADDSLVCVYNGEVYNFLELRAELVRHGYRFRSETDTEVLLAAFHRWGPSAVQRLRGMWAFLIYDRRSDVLFASRDPVGIKPIYLAQAEHDWMFASEPGALLRHPRVSRAPDWAAVVSFLWHEEVPVAPDTFFSGVRALEPGVTLSISAGGSRKVRYWELPGHDTASASDERLVQEFQATVGQAVRLRMRADVPGGTMLSGGLDSTMIASIARQEQGHGPAGRTGVHDVAISAQYPGQWNDETEKVTLVAKHLGMKVQPVFPEGSMVDQLWDDIVFAVQEPFSGSMPVVQYLMMQRAAEVGLKVTLNGHGPDEMLGGYPARHCSFRVLDLFRSGRLIEAHKELKGMRAHHGIPFSDLAFTALREFSPRMTWSMWRKSRASLEASFQPGVVERFGQVPTRFRPGTQEGSSRLDRRLRKEFLEEIVPRYLTYEDRVSMAHSVESRVPFLDREVVELAFRLPDEWKIRGGVTKYILRSAIQGRLPPAIWNDQRKVYIESPYNRWLSDPLRDRWESALGPGSSLADVVHPRRAREIFVRQRGGEVDLSGWKAGFLWRIMVTETWLRGARDAFR